MIRVVNVENVSLPSHPIEVQESIMAFASLLDENYGAERDPIADLGGYLLLVECHEDLQQLSGHLDWQETTPEYVERIPCYIGGDYSLAHFQLSSDYSITVFMPMELLPEQLKKHLEE